MEGVELINLGDGKVIMSFPEVMVNSLTRKSDTDYFAGTTNFLNADTINIWNMNMKDCVTTIVNDVPMHKIIYSPDGKILAGISSDSTIKFFDTEDYDLLYEYKGHSIENCEIRIGEVVFDDRFIFSSDSSGQIQKWK